MPPWCQQFYKSLFMYVCMYIVHWWMKAVNVSPVFCCWHQWYSRMGIISKCIFNVLQNFYSLWTRISMLFSTLVSQIFIKSLLLFWARGETDLTWSSSKKFKISVSHCCLTVCSLQAVLCSPVSCLLTPEFACCRFSPSCPVLGPRPPPSQDPESD